MTKEVKMCDLEDGNELMGKAEDRRYLDGNLRAGEEDFIAWKETPKSKQTLT